jgi:hypothetical protein
MTTEDKPPVDPPEDPKDTDPPADDPKPDDEPEPYRAPDAAEWDRVQKALKRANTEAATRKKELADLRKKSETTDETKVREATEKAETEVRGKLEPVIIGLRAESKFAAAGFKGKNVASMVRLLDRDALKLTDEGDVEGLDAEVKRLKGEYPDLFGKPAGRADGADKPPGGGKPKSTAEKIAALIHAED